MTKASLPPEAARGPYFFLSHAHVEGREFGGSGDPDQEVIDFFHLLCRHLRHLTDIPPESSPGYLDAVVRIGTTWHPHLLDALATCQVFVPLYSPRYFRSQWCGWEWDAFNRRERVHAEHWPYAFSAIVPVLWAPGRLEIPPCAARLQYLDGRLGRGYKQNGLYGLRIEDEREFARVALRLTQTIVEVAEATRLRPCRPELFDEPKNAFVEVS
jgi:hypothetical protein